MPECLSERILFESGPIKLVRRYWRGHHPQLGELHFGRQGKETRQQAVVVRPLHHFRVID